MNLGAVFAFFGALLAIGLALPGLLLAWSLWLPDTVARSSLRLRQTPGRCFGLGAAWLGLSLIPILVLLNLPNGVLQFLGWVGIFVLLTLASLGAAGMATVMGERLRGQGTDRSAPLSLLGGALALELAAVFPIVGWFILTPLIATVSLGATGFALLGWMPRPRPVPADPTAPSSAAIG